MEDKIESLPQQVISKEKIRQNLETQLFELETLQSVFCNPGEIRVEDPDALADIQAFVVNNTRSSDVPLLLDLTINQLVNDEKFEICVNLSHDYPDSEPDCFVRNHSLNRVQHTRLNKDLSDYIAGVDRGEPCIFSAVSWIQDNADKYLECDVIKGVEEEPADKDENLTRLWIYSHHIYSKTKRREIVDLANHLNLSGFSMPGKPGIVCVEGSVSACNEWWQTIKAMNWKRIFCKVTEKECNKVTDGNNSSGGFLKFQGFSEMIFQNNSIKCAHMDMGELLKFLDRHACSYIFKDLFGVESKSLN